MTRLVESFFGIPLTTFRSRDVAEFPYGPSIAAISVLVFRTTIPAIPDKEPPVLRWAFGLVLAALTFVNKSHELILAVELFSYMVPLCLYMELPFSLPVGSDPSMRVKATRLLLVPILALFSITFSHTVATGDFFRWISFVIPVSVWDAVASLLPTREVQAAYDILAKFVSDRKLLDAQIYRLMFITFHMQCGIGYLGIDFLKQEQERRNQLVRMDMTLSEEAIEPPKTQEPDKRQLEQRLQKSRRFQRTAAPFILFTAVPYMVKIIAYGNLNAFAYTCFKDDIHREIRLYDLFEHDSHLVSMAEHSATSPEAYAGYMDTVVSTTYDVFNRKFFSLPKVLLLPMVMARQPKMMAQMFPVIFFTDWVKGRAVSYMTSRVELLQKEIQELNAIRSKVESFDIKNAELLQRAGAGATKFTQRRWEDLTVQVQMKEVVSDLTTRTKNFFAFIQRNWVFTVLVDCTLAHLIAVGKLVSSDVFVFSRAIEDAVDMALMKSRLEAELARMMTQIGFMEELAEVWTDAKEPTLIHCNLAPPDVAEHAVDSHVSMVTFSNLLYSRGTAVVRVDHLELTAGIYALTGANGSGKSTLFRVIMSCNTNERSIALPSSVMLSTPNKPIVMEDDVQREVTCEAADEEEVVVDETESISANAKAETIETHPRLSITMPSSHVVEISQSFYWPLYTKPIDWIFQEHISELGWDEDLKARTRVVAELLHSLEFSQSLVDEQDGQSGDSEELSEGIILGIMEQLQEDKEDWFSDLSGGQRCKVELVRQVFLQGQCPHVLLVDETMAPLDPRSKSLVMSKLKAFCSASVVIVIYHTDVGRGMEGESGDTVECVPSNDFFDANIHVENKTVRLRPVC
eukprot:Nitzschia sp. Nitz4//scaffold3_size479765//445132//447785//NITZ4_000188-RA/size479765-augustus-gene-1.588-mRNA-1//1//CDS//3329551022//6723//frame0